MVYFLEGEDLGYYPILKIFEVDADETFFKKVPPHFDIDFIGTYPAVVEKKRDI